MGFASLSHAQVGLGFDKAFNPATIGPGSHSVLQLTITNPSNSTVEDIAFTDDLPAGVLIGIPSNVFSDCEGAIITAPDGGSTITFTDGRLGAGQTCIVELFVTSSTVGTHTNTTSDLTADIGGAAEASADLDVVSTSPGFSKSFAPAVITPGGTSTLTFTLDNTANGSPISDISLLDFLPAGVIPASPLNFANTCNNATIPGNFSETETGNGVSYFFNGTTAFPAVAAGGTCTISFDVTSPEAGSYLNVSEPLTTGTTGVGPNDPAGIAIASLEVPQTILTKSFVNDPVVPGDQVQLDFTISNATDLFNGRTGSGPFTNMAFTDDLEAVLPGTGDLTLNSVISNDCGGTVSGSTVISFSGGSLASGASCTISTLLDVASSAPLGTYTNTTSSFTFDAGGQSNTEPGASDELRLSADPRLTKEYIPNAISGGDNVVIRYTIENTASTTATDIAFDEELTTFLPFPISASVLPATPCGAGSSIAVISISTDRAGLGFTGGELAGNSSCTFDVTINTPSNVPPGDYTNSTSDITATINSTTATGSPASDELTIVRAPDIIKVFGLNQVAPGGSVDLTFTLEHDNNAPGDASNIGFSDDLSFLPGTIASAGTSGTCNGTLSGIGTGLVTYSGGTMTPGTSCAFTITLDISGTAIPGLYTNITSDVSANIDVNGNAVASTRAPTSDVLEIQSVSVTKEFTDDPVLPGGTVNLRFTIQNETGGNLTDIAFTDDLDEVVSGLTAGGGALGTGSCNGTLNEFGNVLTYSGGSLGPNLSCTIDLTLTVPGGAGEGDYENITSAISAKVDGQNVIAPPAEATLIVADAEELLTLTKTFGEGSVAPGEDVDITFDITFEGNVNASNISFSDDLNAFIPGAVTIGTLPTPSCGGTVSGGSTINYSGGSLTPGSSCSFTVSITVPETAENDLYTNTTSNITADVGIVGNAASDNLGVVGEAGTHNPIADAGPPVDTTDCGNYTLDGTGSISFNPPILHYTWTENGNVIAVGPTATIFLTPGDHLIQLAIIDAAGGDTDEINVFVRPDTVPPVIICPADITISTDPGVCSATSPIIGSATADDECDGALTPTNDAPAVFSLGATTVTWTATDAANNSIQCTQIVTVADTEAPVVTADIIEPSGGGNDDDDEGDDDDDGGWYEDDDDDDGGGNNGYTISCSASDNCDGQFNSTGVVGIPDPTGLTVNFQVRNTKQIRYRPNHDDIRVRAPDPQAFWNEVLNGGGIPVFDGQIINLRPREESDDNIFFRFNSAGDLVTIDWEEIALTCSATDAAGNTGTASDLVTVPLEDDFRGDEIIIRKSVKAHIITPNPSKNEIFVNLEEFQNESVYLEIYSIQGQKVFDGTVIKEGTRENRIDISQFREGTYHLVATQGQKRISATFIKVR